MGQSTSPNAVDPVVDFKDVLKAVVGLTVFAFAGAAVLGVSVRVPTTELKHLEEVCTTLYQVGFGSVAGVLGGRSVR